MKKHNLFIQVSPDNYEKLRALAVEMQISKASARTLVELYLFGKSISNADATISAAQRTAINKALNTIKDELTSRTISQSAKSGSPKKGKQPGNIDGSISQSIKKLPVPRKPRRNL
jgi:hypothetical protein